MKNSSKFFNNYECEYYPCHKNKKNDELNCLFCFCPLYYLKCPGNYKILSVGDKKIKDCMDCNFPHIPDNYDKIMEIIKGGIYDREK